MMTVHQTGGSRSFGSDSDRQCLLSGKELNDSLINAAQTLLAAQYPQIKGFQNTNCERYLNFLNLPKNCVQFFMLVS